MSCKENISDLNNRVITDRNVDYLIDRNSFLASTSHHGGMGSSSSSEKEEEMKEEELADFCSIN